MSKNYNIVRALNDNSTIAISRLKDISTEFKESTSYNNIKVHVYDDNIIEIVNIFENNKNDENYNRINSLFSEVESAS